MADENHSREGIIQSGANSWAEFCLTIHALSGPDGCRHSSDQQPKDVNSEKKIIVRFLSESFRPPELQKARPATEPRNPETRKVHFKVRKMPFRTPPKNGPKSQLKCPKTKKKGRLGGIKMSHKNGLFGHFNWLLGGLFSGGPRWIFWTLNCTFRVSGFRGSGASRGVCNSRRQTRQLWSLCFYRMQLFWLQLEASCLQWSFFTYNRQFLAFLLTVGVFLLTILASLLTIGAFLLTMGKCV